MKLSSVFNHQKLFEGRRENLAYIDNFPYDRIEMNYVSGQEENTIRPLLLKELEWAERVLKKPDRVLWWLKVASMHYYHKSFKKDGYQATNHPTYLKWRKIKPSISKTLSSVFKLDTYKQWFEHFAVYDYPPLLDYPFGNETPDELIENLRTIEDQWRSKRTRKMTADPSHTLILRKGDFVWLNLNKAACKEESAAGGHCGNSPRATSDDRILSLRKVTGEKSQYYYATFILEKDGYLGERKGYANSKPEPKLHPYIVELLKQPFIKGIKHGRFLTKNDFQINDLSPEWREELIVARPDYFPRMEVLDRFSDDLEKVIEIFKNDYDFFFEFLAGPYRKMLSKRLDYDQMFSIVEHHVKTRRVHPLYLAYRTVHYVNFGGDPDPDRLYWYIIENAKYAEYDDIDLIKPRGPDTDEQSLKHRYIEKCLEQGISHQSYIDLYPFLKDGEAVDTMTKDQVMNIFKMYKEVRPHKATAAEFVNNLTQLFTLEELEEISRNEDVNFREDIKATIRVAIRRRDAKKAS